MPLGNTLNFFHFYGSSIRHPFRLVELDGSSHLRRQIPFENTVDLL